MACECRWKRGPSSAPPNAPEFAASWSSRPCRRIGVLDRSYGQAKLAIEEITLDLGGIAVRPGLVYGSDSGGIVGTLLHLARLPVLPLIGAASLQYPVHDEDVAGAIARILGTPDWLSEVIGIAQPEPLRFREILETLASRQRRKCKFVPVPWHPIYWTLRAAEAVRLSLPLRSDSVLGLVRPAPYVPASRSFP